LSETRPPAEALVSVIMAVHNGAPHLRDAVVSVLRQSHHALELLLCDDASTDDGPSIAAELAARDGRIRILRNAVKSGPGAARNLGLDAARGDWIAVIDADDLVHPDRIATLLAMAADLAADVVADDLVPFGAEYGTTLLAPLHLAAPWQPDARDLLAAEQSSPRVPVGYLKPMIHRRVLGKLRYRTDLPIGEDFDLLLRLALTGARVAVVPRPLYFYRRHAASTSHRLSALQCRAIETAIADLSREFPAWAETAEPQLQAWRDRTRRERDFGGLVEAIKGGDIGIAFGMLARQPRLGLPLLRAARQGVARRLGIGGAIGTSRPLVLGKEPDPRLGKPFRVPEPGAVWDGAQAATLARAAGTRPRHLRVVGLAGLRALDYVPGWRLAELVPPTGGWTEDEIAQIAALPWPCRHMDADDLTVRPGGNRAPATAKAQRS
jgi:succinoglycan biosynthesis protein ExoO